MGQQRRSVPRPISLGKSRRVAGSNPVTPPFFRGAVDESFDGIVKEVDLRGRVPLCKLVLSGSQNEIDCTFSGLSTEEIRGTLDTRAWIDGKAIYDGYSGLPERFEIRKVDPMNATGSPDKWRGQMKPFDLDHG